MAENEEKLKNFLMQVKKESEKAGLKLNIHKMKIMASGPITSSNKISSFYKATKFSLLSEMWQK